MAAERANRRFALLALAACGVLTLASCWGDLTGPGKRGAGRFAIAPVFDDVAMSVVDVNRLRVRLVRGDGSVAVDTIVPFSAGDTIITLSLSVQVYGAQETFSLFTRLIDDPAGDTVFASGPDPVVAMAGVPNPPAATPQLLYTGVGSEATGVRFVQSLASAFFGDTVSFTAEAFGSDNVVIPNTPILFSSSDTLKARVPEKGEGVVVVRSQRGSTSIRAELLRTSLTQPAAAVTRTLVVQPRAATLAVQAGNNQSGAVGTALPLPVTARVLAADMLGVQGTVVTFAVASGGGSLSALVDTTDATGDASATSVVLTAP